MITSSQSPYPASDELSAAFLLISREIDGDLAEPEMVLLAKMEAIWPLETSQFRIQCLQLRSLIHALPVHTAASSFQPSRMALSLRSSPLPTSPPRRSGAQRLVVGLVTSVLCGGLVLALMRPQDASDRALTAQTDVSVSAKRTADGPVGSAAAFDAIVPEAKSVPMVAAIPSAVSSGEALSGVSTTDFALPDSGSMISPLIHSDNWHVVVVKVDGRDRDQAMDLIESIVQEHGLRLQSSLGDDQPEWLGVVLTSADTADVVTAMEKGLGEASRSAESSDRQMSHSASSEIVASVRESLRYPTRSELHHGRIFVALPKEAPFAPQRSMESVETGPAASKKAVGSRLIEPVTKVAETGLGADAIVSRNTNAEAVVTLVVFEFAEARKAVPGDTDPQI